MSKYTPAILALSLLVLILGLQPLQADTPPAEIDLTIIHTNDLHGHIFPYYYDKFGKEENSVAGAPRVVGLIRALKECTESNVLVMDSGDLFNRGPLEHLGGKPETEILAAVPYDILTIGNNEIKGAEGYEGQEIMFRLIGMSQVPFVSANMYFKSTDERIVAPFKVFDVQGVRVVVYGLQAERVKNYPQAKGLIIEDGIVASKKVLAELDGKADFIVCLSHLGYLRDLQLARECGEIDVIIGGDSHSFLFSPSLVKRKQVREDEFGSVIVCQAGEWWHCVGELKLHLKKVSNGSYTVDSYRGKLHEVTSDIVPASGIAEIVERYGAEYDEVLGELPATVPYSKMAGFVAGCLRNGGQADIGVFPTDNVECGLQKGKVTLLDVKKVFPFEDELVVVKMTGKQFLQSFTSSTAGFSGVESNGRTFLSHGSELEEGRTFSVAMDGFHASYFSKMDNVEIIPANQSVEKTVSDVLGNEVLVDELMDESGLGVDSE